MRVDGMTGASPVTTILFATEWQSRASPCIVVTGLAPVMPLSFELSCKFFVFMPLNSYFYRTLF